jgi:ferritin-like metal-binding protein YciE
MADDVSRPPDSFPEIYLDLLWNLAASTRIMRLKLPALIAEASNPELVAILGDCMALTGHHDAAINAIVSRIDRPARFHAAELETLLGTADRELSGWSRGEARDLAITSVVRTSVHMAIPTCELAASLAAVLGHQHHVAALTRLREDIAVTDSRLQAVIRTQVTAHRLARATSRAAESDLNAPL